ncbi:MAG: hypothetical protein ACRD3B_01115 [Candidatus Sulfotelmatobacter sp.]
MRLLAAITLLTAISPWAAAQRMSGFAPHPGVPAAPGFTGNGNGNRPAGNGFHGNGFGRGSLSFAHGNQGFPGGFAVPFFSDALYSDLLSTGYPAVSQPPVFVMQPPANISTAASFPAPEKALMIELRGDRYVQVDGPQSARLQSAGPQSEEKSTAQMQNVDPASAAHSASKLAGGIVVRASQNEPLLATLVYRDGHREDVTDYTIANGTVYAKADYYKSGSWSRKIELSSLNLPETVQLNQSRGLNFQLPSAPNEVIVGP